MSSGDKEAEASEDLAEDTSTSRCAEANTSADRVSLPASSDDDELVILFEGHILDDSNNEGLTNSEASEDSTDDSEFETSMTIDGVNPLVPKPSSSLEAAIAEWTAQLVKDIENENAKLNSERDNEDDQNVSEHKEQGEILRSTTEERDKVLVDSHEKSNETSNNTINDEIVVHDYSEGGSPLLRSRMETRMADESVEIGRSMLNLISLDDDEQYFADESSNENTTVSNVSSSLLDNTVDEEQDNMNKVHSPVLLEDVGVDEISAIIDVLKEEHKNIVKANKRQFTIAIEGNIGSGKSTFLQHFNDYDNVEVITEPVEKWTDLKGCNLLQKMYEDPKRWSLVFQTYVQLTMLQQHSSRTEKEVKLMERSLYSAMHCFAENLVRNKKMEKSEYEVLYAWFRYLVDEMKDIIDLGIDLIVYLKTSPETAMERIRVRSRGEECIIPKKHVEQLHLLYEDWLINKKFPLPCPVITIDANQELGEVVKEYLERGDHIFGRKNGDEEENPESLINID